MATNYGETGRLCFAQSMIYGSKGAVVDVIYFLLAVSATSAVIFALMMRADRINRRRGSDGGASDPSINDSSLASWFGPYGGGRNDW